MESGARRDEVHTKLTQLRERMAARELDAILLEQTANVAWLTAGAETAINSAADRGPVALLVTPDRAYAVTDGVEAPRLEQEEGLADLGFELVVEPWYRLGAFVADRRARLRVGDDEQSSSRWQCGRRGYPATAHDATSQRCRAAAPGLSAGRRRAT